MILTYALLFGVAAMASLCLTPLVGRLAVRLGAIDMPGERRVHARPTPRLGGLAVYASVVASFALVLLADPNAFEAAEYFRRHLRPLALGATLVVALGVVDDVRSLPPVAKLVLQFAAASMVVGSGFVVGD
ncbi:MAG: undecaprenyl/decaprenyl-phosphate alpha-N-acetylglucosaminyl 1-phosphate transferase, partial [Candidatus Binatia bacterium]